MGISAGYPGRFFGGIELVAWFACVHVHPDVCVCPHVLACMCAGTAAHVGSFVTSIVGSIVASHRVSCSRDFVLEGTSRCQVAKW